MREFYGFKNIPAWLWQVISGFGGREPSWDLARLTYVVIDTETTGFDFNEDRILCLGALRLHNQRIDVGNCLEIFIKQDYYNRKSTEVHGILSREGRPCLEESGAMQRFLEFLGDDIIVAHHAQFDIGMINNALQRNNLPLLKNRVLDTSALYRKTIINSPLVAKKDTYSLDELADKFDISKQDRHTALGDSYITAIAFIKILQALKKKGITTCLQVVIPFFLQALKKKGITTWRQVVK